ncbi:MAG: alkaline phosphatase family protein [Planctomycetes bacterium]|nr:alkaline phosphatase family protein [Planctomycetota bacterium]
MPKVLVLNVAGLSPALLAHESRCPRLAELRRRGWYAPLAPVFPALTCPAQATYTTGLPPGKHGVVANGLYDRDHCRWDNWEQPTQLVAGEKVWEARRAKQPGFRSAMLFWQNSKYSSNDVIVTPAPVHTPDGKTISTCWSRPVGFYEERLTPALSPFALFCYWGPLTNIAASEWIARCVRMVVEGFDPDLTLAYLPHLDYSLQKFGPTSREALDDLAQVDALLGGLFDFAGSRGMRLIVLSEYGMDEVSHAAPLNRALRQAGLLAVREVEGIEHLDAGASRAFALVDHEVAHVFVQHGARPREVAALLSRTEGVGATLVGEKALTAAGLGHPRAGDVVCVAARGWWFSYPWWFDDAKRPAFARGIDIHNKAGYDPLEMFWDQAGECISLDTTLIRGSHGRRPEREEEMAVFLSDQPETRPAGSSGPARALDVRALIERHLD